MDRLERAAVEPIDSLPSVLAHVDEADLSQNAEVLGHLWLRETEPLDEVVHRTLPAGEDAQDLSSPWLGDGVEGVGGCGGSGHGDNIYAHIGIRQGGAVSRPGGAGSAGSLEEGNHIAPEKGLLRLPEDVLDAELG